jgi:hypothetical protein
VILFGLAISWIVQAKNVDAANQVYGWRPCKVRDVLTIEDPFPQNVTNVVYDKTCKFYKHLPTELIIEDQPVVNQALIAATVVFIIIFIWFSIVVFRSGKRGQ